MSNGANIPVTVQGSLQDSGVMTAIGANSYRPQSANALNSLWYLVVNLSNLQVVANEITTSNNQVPATVGQYAGTPGYLLVVASQALRTDNVPQGDVYTFLQNCGAGPLLDRAEQINTQLGTGTIGNVSYILATTTDGSNGGGFEEFDINGMTVMTFALMPVTVNGQTTYSPIFSTQ